MARRNRKTETHARVLAVIDERRRTRAAMEEIIEQGKQQAKDRSLPANVRAASHWLAAGMAAALIALGGCAARVGSSITQDQARRDLVNGSPVTVTIDDNSGERVTVNGTAASGYTLSNETESRWLYTGSTPVNASARRGVDGTWALNMASGKDVAIAAERVNLDPATGKIEARGVRLSSDASTPTRAGNEALDRLGAYWAARDEAARQVLIEQIKTTGEIPKDLAPFVVQLLLGL
jgi:hypothetical protein